MTTKTWRGAWAASTLYSLNDLVNYSGTFYTCLRKHTSGTVFSSVEWLVYIPTLTEIQASTNAVHAKTDSEFTSQFAGVVSAIATAVATGLYSTTVSLNELDYNTVKLTLELKGYRVTSNRTGYGNTTSTVLPCTISWVKY